MGKIMAKRKTNKSKNTAAKVISIILTILLSGFVGYNIGAGNFETENFDIENFEFKYFENFELDNINFENFLQYFDTESSNEIISLESIPEYDSEAYCVINENIPYFTDEEMTDVSFEIYNDLDYLGRCTYALASVGIDLMPTEDRESISSVYPTGWVQAEYDIVSSSYLYNRCHLIGFQLTGENANENNLITGTRYLNVDGMLPFENMIADYINETGNHVYYRVTVIFEDENLLASGVLLEAKSVEDDGEGICFNVYCYNVQPGITIDYTTGESYLTN